MLCKHQKYKTRQAICLASFFLFITSLHRAYKARIGVSNVLYICHCEERSDVAIPTFGPGGDYHVGL